LPNHDPVEGVSMFDGESIVAYELVIHEAAALEIALFDFLIKIFWRYALQAEFAKAVFDRYFPEARLAKKELIFGAHKLIIEVWFDFSSIDKTPQQEVRVEKNVHKSTNSSSVISQSSRKETVALPSKVPSLRAFIFLYSLIGTITAIGSFFRPKVMPISSPSATSLRTEENFDRTSATGKFFIVL